MPTLIQRNYVYRYVGPSLGQCRTPTSFAHGGVVFSPIQYCIDTLYKGRHVSSTFNFITHHIVVQQCVCMSAILGPHGPMVTEVSQLFVYGSRFTKRYHNVPGSAPLRKHLNIFERNCLAVHEQSALWVMGAGLSKGHQDTAYHSPLRHFNIVLS